MKIKISLLLGTMVLGIGIINNLHGQLEDAVFACGQETVTADFLAAPAPDNKLTAQN